MELKVDSELFRELAPKFDTYAFPGTVRVLDIEWRASCDADDELALGNGCVRQRSWKVLFRRARSFQRQSKSDRKEKQIAGRRALFMETNSRDLFYGRFANEVGGSGINKSSCGF
jgi:membrane protein implicated in regulation of membrane protease activity